MKTTYKLIVRRRVEGHLRLRSQRKRSLEPSLDDPIELPSEVIDVATGELVDRRRRTKSK